MDQDYDNIKIIPLWPTNIVTTVVDIDTTALISEVYKLKSKESAVTKSNYGGWQSNIQIHENNVFTELFSKCSNILYFTFQTKHVTFKQTWACINKPNDFNLIHAHGNQYHISGVYYLQVPDQSGDIAFRDPRPAAINSSTQKIFNQGDTENFTPINKQLIFFPSYLEHFVLPNESTQDRISISFDAIIG
jgi:uncharacterized protein (TIGR02466 family)